MCDLEKVQIFWYELLPYVDVTACQTDIVNHTGVIYNFFMESYAECCGSKKIYGKKLNQTKLQHQQAVLNAVRSPPGSAGMPISLDAEFPHTPEEFVPVLETDGLYWVKVKDPCDAYALGGISTTGMLLLLVVITLTGYIAVVLWILESRTKERQFCRSFIHGIFDSYWCAFISATTIGYGDKVPQSIGGKLFTMVWILCGICLISTFTAITTAVMSTFMNPVTKPKPFYDEFIGVLDGSFDYLVLVKKSFPDTDSLTSALNNGSTSNIVIDKHAYWIYRAKINQNQSFEFRPGVQNPTSIGYVYNTKNRTMLRCLKNYAMQRQGHVTRNLDDLIKVAVRTQAPDKVPDEALFFGPYTYTFIVSAVGFFTGICVIGAVIDYAWRLQRMKHTRRVSRAAPNAEDSNTAGDFNMRERGRLLHHNGSGLYMDEGDDVNQVDADNES